MFSCHYDEGTTENLKTHIQCMPKRVHANFQCLGMFGEFWGYCLKTSALSFLMINVCFMVKSLFLFSSYAHCPNIPKIA